MVFDVKENSPCLLCKWKITSIDLVNRIRPHLFLLNGIYFVNGRWPKVLLETKDDRKFYDLWKHLILMHTPYRWWQGWKQLLMGLLFELISQHNPQSKWFWAIEKLEHTTNGPKSIGSDTIDQIGLVLSLPLPMKHLCHMTHGLNLFTKIIHSISISPSFVRLY